MNRKPSLCVRRLGYAVCLLLIACGRADTRNTTDSKVDATTSVPGMSATVTALPEAATTLPEAATAFPEVQMTALPEITAPIVERAREQGTVRIIVTLAVPWKPEGELSDDGAREAQRRAIAAAQQAFLDRLKSFNVTDVTSFQFIPSVALVADAPALAAIIADAAVQSIQEDTPAAPSQDGPAAPSLDAPSTMDR